jgi:hypothetical protein
VTRPGSRRTFATVLGISCGLGLYACGGGPSGPSGSTPPPAAPSVPNTPPVILSIALSNARAEVDHPLRLTAYVMDAETPLDQLTYSWTATPANGTFIGNGPLIDWQPPPLQRTPDTYALTLTVTERYTQSGQAMQNTVSSTVEVHYNDSSAEITVISTQFLKDFTTFSTSAAECVRNFSDSCVKGKSEEFSQITGNRMDFHILGGDYHVQTIAYNADRTFANITVPCTFYDIPTGGSSERVDGICLLTAVYENWKWWLCESHFQGISTTPYTVMGRALMRGSSY